MPRASQGNDARPRAWKKSILSKGRSGAQRSVGPRAGLIFGVHKGRHHFPVTPAALKMNVTVIKNGCSKRDVSLAKESFKLRYQNYNNNLTLLLEVTAISRQCSLKINLESGTRFQILFVFPVNLKKGACLQSSRCITIANVMLAPVRRQD